MNSDLSGLDQLEVQVVGQAAHVVVALDGGGVGGGTRLDHIGVQRALHQEPCVGNAAAGPLERPDELLAHHPSLGLGIGDAGQGGEELVGRVHAHKVDAEVAGEGLLHLVGLILTQQARVHQHAREPIADGPVHECGGHRGVHAAGQTADGQTVADLVPDGRDRGIDDRVHRPARPGAAALPQEALDHLAAIGRVLHLGMELHGVQPLDSVLEGGHGRRRGGSGDRRAVRRIGNRVEVAHPHRLGRG